MQTSKTAALMAQFENFIPPRALVIRDGNESSVEAAKLVPGDLIRIKGGENIPADIRIIEWHEMKVNNASLTGESDDLLRKVEKTSDNPLETANLAFFGTSWTFGNGLGLVINTGDIIKIIFNNIFYVVLLNIKLENLLLTFYIWIIFLLKLNQLFYTPVWLIKINNIYVKSTICIIY